jgi:hypothetical protein
MVCIMSTGQYDFREDARDLIRCFRVHDLRGHEPGQHDEYAPEKRSYRFVPLTRMPEFKVFFRCDFYI